EEDEFYNFDVSRSRPKGYGIQIGSYRELVNLVHFSENLKSSYRKEVTVQVKVINGVKVYTVIVGEFPTREKANQFKAEVQNKYPDAFIVEFEKM
ncbi:MAG: SPOR domain-containing protein, partial [Cyclobacteriaceae bacterium]|nr:SPOR domain-containing protein [Cyclobacteriaceae bacterium]